MISRILFFLLLPFTTWAQYAGPFDKIEIRIDTMRFDTDQHMVVFNGEEHLYFKFQEARPFAEIRLYISRPVDQVAIAASREISLVDSLFWNTDGYYQARVRFSDLINSSFLSLRVQSIIAGRSVGFSLPLLPYTETSVQLRASREELYIGEEKIFELPSNLPSNIFIDNQWVEGRAYDYRLSLQNDKLRLHLVANRLGPLEINIPITTRRPTVNAEKEIVYQADTLRQMFTVKASRLAFLNINLNNVILNEQSSTEGVEIQLQDNRNLQLNKTYRVERQNEPGGALIAEIYTRSRLSNNQVLCWLRPYNYHNQSQGYLYIKDGDDSEFLTNLNILHETEIQKISVLTDQGRWQATNSVNPGQLVDLKVEGVGLNNAPLYFEGINKVAIDSLTGDDRVQYYRLDIPMDIRKKEIRIIQLGEYTGRSISIDEYHRPAPLDFVNVNVGNRTYRLTDVEGPILYDQTISDIVVEFNPELIDKAVMHGLQQVDLQFEIRSSRNDLIDMKEVEDYVICPSISSPRYAMYNKRNCKDPLISLNEQLNKKTYDLDDWSRVTIRISHDKLAYGGEGYTDEITILQKRNISFDIDVSFPAGLLTKRAGNDDFDNLGGISMAMISQFTFYHPEKIATPRPYKVGAGFIALNAFNFSEDNSNRDIGFVVLGSLYPRSNSKLTFPLYLGGGYLLTDGDWFFMLGPGIRVSL